MYKCATRVREELTLTALFMARAHILGISAFYHDSAACLVQDGRVVAAAQEERFTRKKHDHRFPESAIAYCLDEAGLRVSDLTHIAFYDKPWIKFERLLETYLMYAPAGLPSFIKAMPLWLKEKLWMGEYIKKQLGAEAGLYYPEHHESHAASAFFLSPFERAAILTIDGVGEWTTTSWGVGAGNTFRLDYELKFPHSLGLLYSAFTYYTGFRVNSGEYKLMGLAPYGTPRYAGRILDELIDVKEDGSFRLNMAYFNYCQGLTMTSKNFHRLFGGAPRKPESEITQRDMDLAASIQQVVEEVLLRLVRHIKRETGERNLCMAGGVALNCVANGKIWKEDLFDRLWIQPAAGDAGGALGAALMVWHRYLGQERSTTPGVDGQQGSFLGPAFDDHAVQAVLDDAGVQYDRMSPAELPLETARLLAQGKAVGWFQGRMEFGPRALGARSILADPRRPDTQRVVNRKIKFRESFRPFAPSVAADRCSDYFDLDSESPYMLLVAGVQGAEIEGAGFERLNNISSPIPAVTHVDGSARIQTVTDTGNPMFYELLKAFESLTGCPVLVNTSFNVRGEPIVCTPEDALQCFLRTHLDALVIGPFVVSKERLDPARFPAFSQEAVVEAYGLD